MVEKIKKTPDEWKEQLNSDQYEICINHGTEPPFSGKYMRRTLVTLGLSGRRSPLPPICG